MRNPSNGRVLPNLIYEELPLPTVIHRDEDEQDLADALSEFGRLSGTWEDTQPLEAT